MSTPVSALRSVASLAGSLLQGKSVVHPWRFFRAGGLDQVLLETADDLRHLRQLDPKLWVALSCPTTGLEFDPKTLALLDTDKDNRVRVPEIVAAVEWSCTVLKDPAALIPGTDGVPLTAFNDQTPQGAALLAAAQQILANLGTPDATVITIAQAADTARIFGQTTFNGDGVIKPGCARDPALAQIITDAITTHGSTTDRSGALGVNKAQVDAFLADGAAFVAWHAADPTDGHPLGNATPAAWAALEAVRAKIDDWFNRCALAAYDSRAAVLLGRSDADVAALAPQNLAALGTDIEGLPLARIQPGAALDLEASLNPAWAARISTLRTAAIAPLLGDRTRLDRAAWLDLCALLAPYGAWIAAKKGAAVEKLGLARVRDIMAANPAAALHDLIDQDLAVAPKVAAIQDVERLARYHRDLFLLLRNFVNFSDFYDRQPPPPVFMSGTLYLDQRSFELCVRVADPGAHSVLANLGRIFIAYCQCSRPSGEKMTVAVGITQGDSDYLMVGRNGVFIDRKGQDWDATVVKLLDHPISIGQAFWSPYKKIGKMISDLVEKIAGDKDKGVMDAAQAKVAAGATAVTAGKPAEKPKLDTGMLAAIGIAATSAATAVSGLVGALAGMNPLKLPFLFLGVILGISGPSMVIAYLKLRQRTLGPLLEANGWAINGRIKINIPLGNSLTTLKTLPEGAQRQFDDPFEDKEAKRRKRKLLIWTTLILAAILGAVTWFEQWGNVGQFVMRAAFPEEPKVEATATPAAPAAEAKK